ncbi:hypothetical protein AVEN_206270-1 [Araneus ventricosus]|uniref:DUF4817 domain-containing protein n=1 Tax=Araneus ventricosus TaxID=182803 RepID=A0A4Y1ZUF0_ARAVE|nr:hypothetical protein AVEN_206270-1 [Araneus ventricosus]
MVAYWYGLGFRTGGFQPRNSTPLKIRQAFVSVASPHPARQTILKVVKRLRETGCVTSRPRVRRPSNVGRKVQPEDVLAYALAHPRSNSPGPSLEINMGSTRYK